MIAIMTSGGPAESTNLLSYHIHKTAFKMNRFGSAAAMSYSLSIVCFFLTYIYIKVFMGRSNDDTKKPDKSSKRQRRMVI